MRPSTSDSRQTRRPSEREEQQRLPVAATDASCVHRAAETSSSGGPAASVSSSSCYSSVDHVAAVGSSQPSSSAAEAVRVAGRPTEPAPAQQQKRKTVLKHVAAGGRKKTPDTPPHGGVAGRRQPKATFNLKPEYIPVHRLSTSELGSAAGDMYDSEDAFEYPPMTAEELAAMKDANQRRVKRIVAAVGITLTVLSVVLVFISLSLGRKIDEMVGQSMGSAVDLNQKENGFYLGAATKPPSNI